MFVIYFLKYYFTTETVIKNTTVWQLRLLNEIIESNYIDVLYHLLVRS